MLEVEGRKVALRRHHAGGNAGIRGGDRRGGEVHPVEPGVYRRGSTRWSRTPRRPPTSWLRRPLPADGRIPGLGSGSPQGTCALPKYCGEMGCEVEIAGESGRGTGPGPAAGCRGGHECLLGHHDDPGAIAPFADAHHHKKRRPHPPPGDRPDLRRGDGARAPRDHCRAEPLGYAHYTQRPRPAVVKTYGDHRMAMAFAVTGLVAPGIRIQDPGCVTKTFPDYFDRLDTCGEARRAFGYISGADGGNPRNHRRARREREEFGRAGGCQTSSAS